MSTVLSNMGLVEWNAGGDEFSHAELAANFEKIDSHNHASGNGVQVPTSGLVDGAVTSAKLASGSVDNTKVVSGSLSDTRLASPSNPVYRTLISGPSIVAPSTAGTYLFGQGGTGVVTGADVSFASGGLAAAATHYIALVDYTVPNKGAQLRLRATCLTNATAPAVDYTVRLYPVASVAGGSAAMRWNLGSASGGLANFTAPAASSRLEASSPISWPSDGFYALGLTVSGSAAANSVAIITPVLSINHISPSPPPP